MTISEMLMEDYFAPKLRCIIKCYKVLVAWCSIKNQFYSNCTRNKLL